MTLKGDRWGGNGAAYRKYERYLSTEGRKNRKAMEQLEADGNERDSSGPCDDGGPDPLDVVLPPERQNEAEVNPTPERS
jgi:hypothetical protein